MLGYLWVSNGRIDWAPRWLQRFMSCLFHPCKAELPGLQVTMNFRDGSGGSKSPYPVKPCRTKTGFNRSELRRITWYARYVAMISNAISCYDSGGPVASGPDQALLWYPLLSLASTSWALSSAMILQLLHAFFSM